MSSPDQVNGWREWSKHVLLTLEDADKRLKRIEDSLIKMHIEIAMLKVKSGVWGGVAGLIPALLVYLSK